VIKVNILSTGTINQSGDSLSIELVEPGNMPAAILLRWATKPSVCTPDAYANVAAGIMQILAGADHGLEEAMNPSGGHLHGVRHQPRSGNQAKTPWDKKTARNPNVCTPSGSLGAVTGKG
jgi:hypothetical protein